MQNRNFAAADRNLVVLAAPAARLDGNHILSWRQIGIKHKLRPCRIRIKKLRLHYSLITALRAAFNPDAFFRISWINSDYLLIRVDYYCSPWMKNFPTAGESN